MKKRKKLFNIATKHSLAGLIFVTPWIIGFLVFFLYPLEQSVIYSLNKVTITAKGRGFTPVGFDNFNFFFTKEPAFIEGLVAFIKNVVLEVPLILVFSVVLAILLNQKVKLKGIFRTLFFLPIIVVSGPVISMISGDGTATVPIIEQYHVYDMINAALPRFLIDPVSNLFSQLIFILWYSGVPILIFFSGLQKIDVSLYEASSIDGASSWVSFWKIVLPAIKGLILINTMYIIVFLASSENNYLVIRIKEIMKDPSRGGYGAAAAGAWIYSISIALLLLISYLLFGREAKSKVKHSQIIRKRGY